LRCYRCDLKMRPVKINIRIGGWKGLWKLLPVVAHICPKCGKMEFVAEEKTKKKLVL